MPDTTTESSGSGSTPAPPSTPTTSVTARFKTLKKEDLEHYMKLIEGDPKKYKLNTKFYHSYDKPGYSVCQAETAAGEESQIPASFACRISQSRPLASTAAETSVLQLEIESNREFKKSVELVFQYLNAICTQTKPASQCHYQVALDDLKDKNGVILEDKKKAFEDAAKNYPHIKLSLVNAFLPVNTSAEPSTNSEPTRVMPPIPPPPGPGPGPGPGSRT